MRSLNFTVALLFTLILASSGTGEAKGTQLPETSDAEVVVQPDDAYRIRSKDIVGITVYPDETLTRSVEVNTRGLISFPLIGKFEIGGLTVSEAEEKLAAVLEKDYLVDPVVSIKIEQYHESVAVVIGQVGSPSSYPIDPSGRTTLMRLIAAAGGFTDVAAINKVKIIRIVEGREEAILVNVNDIISGRKKDPRIIANDLVIVPETFL